MGGHFFSLSLSLSLSILIVARTNSSLLFFVASFELKINHFRDENRFIGFIYIYIYKTMKREEFYNLSNFNVARSGEDTSKF